MTSAEMITALRLRLGDPDSLRWDSDNELYSALSTAQRLFVTQVLGAKSFHDNFEIFSDITTSKSFSVGVVGYDLSGLNPGMSRNGYISSRVIVQGRERYITRLPQSKIGLINNQYFRGNDWTPKCYIEGNVYKLLIDMGSYPKTVTMSYVSVPASISATSQPQVNAGFHDVLLVMAEIELRRSIDEIEQAAALQQMIVLPTIQLIASGGVNEPKSHTLGQTQRDRQMVLEKGETQ